MNALKITISIFLICLSISCEETKTPDQVNTSEKEDLTKTESTEKQDPSITPRLVKENFKEKYPGENDPDWQLDDKGNWEANFKKDGVHYRADYNADGSWIETENSIKKGDLPKVIMDIIKSKYNDMEISEIEMVDHHKKGIFYDVEFKREGKNLDIEFNEKGEILNN